MNESDRIRIRHMLDACRKAIEFSSGRSRADLNGDDMLVYSLARAVEIVGEAANHVSQATQEELSSIPWEDIVGMRHRIVHDYYDINLDILWETVVTDIPELITLLAPMVSEA